MDGSYYLVDDDGNIKATIGNIIIFTADERNNAFGDIVPTTIVENEEYLLNIVVDADYLADPDTIYPIRIDPTIEINYDNNGGSAIEDITISTNKNFSGSHDSLYVGRRSTEGIARALMRFPGLNLSNLAGATVTSATVQLRDLMCESDELAISCHVFTGNVWDANSATWSNVSPNSYVSTAMSTNTMSWSIGKTHSPVHWYSFDISSAVQGWIDGNYTQSKGIIFKVASSVENGSTIANRTFGSFNRASYKPSVSVTYTSAGSQILENNTYYINNDYSGHYMQYTSNGTIAGTAGYISSLSDTIRWDVQKVSNGYVLRAKSDPTKYLGVASNVSSTAVEVVTISDAAIPARCIWNITYASGGGCLIRNFYNANYLYTYGTTLYTSSTLGEPGYSSYSSRVWRIASTSYYGNTSSSTYRELPTSYYAYDLNLDVCDIKNLPINTIYSNVLWASASDFIITISNVDIAKVASDNRIEGYNRGTCTVSLKHKVTEITSTHTCTITVSSSFSATMSKLEDLYDAALTYDSTPRDAALLVMQFIRRGKYNDGAWPTVAGSIDSQFDEYVSDYYSALYRYFTIEDTEDYYYQDPAGEGYVDFPHLCATLNGLIYDADGFKAAVAGEANVDNLCGWAGDLQTLCKEVLDYTNNSNDYNTIYDATYDLIGDPDYSLSMMDLLADTDAYNISTLLNSSASNLISSISTYYENYSDERYTRFTNGWSKQTIYMCVRNYTTNTFIWGVDWPLLEGYDITDTQANAIASAFTDFIWEKIQNEQNSNVVVLGFHHT